MLYDMSRKDYKNEEMKSNACEKIRLKLFSTKRILLRKLTFLWLD